MITVVIRTTLVQDTDSRGDVPMWDKEYVCIWEISVLLVQFFCGPKVAQKKKKIYLLQNENVYYRTFSTSQPSFSHVKGNCYTPQRRPGFCSWDTLWFYPINSWDFSKACCWVEHLENMFLIRCYTVWAGSMRRVNTKLYDSWTSGSQHAHLPAMLNPALRPH